MTTIRIEECFSDEVYTKSIKIFGVKVYSLIKKDERTNTEKKDAPIGFQTMNNILDHYSEL